MEKLRNILSPGHSKDDEVMYNTPEKDETAGTTGKVTGQGSHFGSSSAPQEVSAAGTGLTSVSDPLNTSGQPTTLENAPASTERETLPTSAETPATTAGGETGSAALGETSTDSTTYQKPETSTVGRETAEPAHSAGALTAATLAFRKAEETKATGGAMPGGYPSPDSSNPYVTSHLDPRVDKEPHSTSSQPTYDRSAKAAGATAGTGAYEAEEQKPLASSTEPTVSTASESTHVADTSATDRTADSYTEPQNKPSIASKVLGVFGLGKDKSVEEDASAVDTTSSKTSAGPPAHHRKESIPTTAYPSGSFESPRAIHAPVGGTEKSAERSTSGRHAAVAGTAAGAAGLVGAAAPREGTVDQFANQPYSSREKPPVETTGESAGGTSAVGSGMAGHTLEEKRMDEPATTTQSDVPYRAESTPYHALATAPPAETSRTAQPTTKTGDSHLGRDAAIGGAAGVGAAGLAEEEHRRREQEATQKEREKQQAAATKHAEKEEKAHEKAVAKEEKAREKEEKKAMKEHDKEEKKAAKEAEKEQKAAEKQAAKEEKEREKLGAAEEKEREKEEKERRKHEAGIGAAGFGAAAVGTGAYEAEKHHHEDAGSEPTRDAGMYRTPGATAGTAPLAGTGAHSAGPVEESSAEPSTTHPLADTAAGAGAAGVAAQQLNKHDASTATSEPTEPTGLTAADAANREAYGRESLEPTSAAGGAPTSTTEPLNSGTGEPTSTDHSGMSAAAVYAAEKEAGAEGHTLPKDHHLELPPGLTGLAAADEIDRRVYGGGNKKPSFFRRIFRSRKNKDTGDDEQYETDEEYEGEEQGTHGQEKTTA